MTEFTELKQMLSIILTIAARSLHCYYMLNYDKDSGQRRF
jgi:hypothetical protein